MQETFIPEVAEREAEKNRRRAARRHPPLPASLREPKTTKAQDSKARYYACMIPPATLAESNFRHSAWMAKRSKVRATMEATYVNDFTKNRFDECGSQCVVEYSKTEKKHRIRGSFCHSRHCEPCARAKAATISANLKNRLASRPRGQARYRFITLGLRHTDAPLAEQIKRLYACFKKLRNTKTWKRTQVGGAFMLEVKWDPQSPTNRGRVLHGLRPQWHPHLHIFSEGNFLDAKTLSALWLESTGDSNRTDIRAIDSGKDAAAYVSKYICKSANSEVWNDPDARNEWFTASKGIRICATFGNWRGFKLLEKRKSAEDWAPVATLNAVLAAAARQELWAEGILLSLRPPGQQNEEHQRPTYTPPGP